MAATNACGLFWVFDQKAEGLCLIGDLEDSYKCMARILLNAIIQSIHN